MNYFMRAVAFETVTTSVRFPEYASGGAAKRAVRLWLMCDSRQTSERNSVCDTRLIEPFLIPRVVSP
jgi:hypothetical protein